MKKFYLVLLLAFISSCAITNPPSGPGVFYTDVKELLYYDEYVVPTVSVTSCSNNYFGFVSIGDSGLTKIKSRSEIKRIHSIERTYENTFFVSAKSCLIVKGQNH
ncbi:MAG: hypothetical protein KGQ36_05430 [Rickettsiales bacterium]|nr:hypothetical protein [Rickettsiales bacterium]